MTWGLLVLDGWKKRGRDDSGDPDNGNTVIRCFKLSLLLDGDFGQKDLHCGIGRGQLPPVNGRDDAFLISSQPVLDNSLEEMIPFLVAVAVNDLQNVKMTGGTDSVK
jgi:hypothetical protein